MHLVSRIIADREVSHIKQTTGQILCAFGISEGILHIITDKQVNHIKQITGFGISECMVHIIADKKVDHIKDNTDCAFSISKGMLHIIIDKDNHIKENTCHSLRIWYHGRHIT